jgi:DNA-directed RNA polymerase specialized sigma subunit
MVVHLRYWHKKSKRFKHPLLDGVKPVSKEQLEVLVAEYLENKSQANRTALILSMRSVIRHLVGRYLANWPSTRNSVYDMVSEGMLTVVKTVDTLTNSTLNGRSIMKVVSQRAAKAIEAMLYETGSMCCPGKRTQETYAAEGLDTPYITNESDLTGVSIEDNLSKEVQDLFDTEDALEVMAAQLQLDADLMKSEYRGLSSAEVAEMLGVHKSTILRHRAKLQNLYRVEFGG